MCKKRHITCVPVSSGRAEHHPNHETETPSNGFEISGGRARRQRQGSRPRTAGLDFGGHDAEQSSSHASPRSSTKSVAAAIFQPDLTTNPELGLAPFSSFLEDVASMPSSLADSMWLVNLPPPSDTSDLRTRTAFGAELWDDVHDLDVACLEGCNNIFFMDHGPTATRMSKELEAMSPSCVEAFESSVWSFKPEKFHSSGSSSEPHLILPAPKRLSNCTYHRTRLANLQSSNRDSFLALVINNCSSTNVASVVEAFPSLELLNSLLQIYLTSPLLRADARIHVSALPSIAQRPAELLLAMIAAGAVVAPDLALRKLGFALHEIVRRALQQKVRSSHFRCNTVKNFRLATD